MAGLAETVANLARYRSLASGLATGGVAGVSSTPLQETRDWGANPGDLRMFSYAPVHADKNAAMVVVLHGCTQTAAAYAQGAGWLEQADRHGFVVLCPEQQAANNQNGCFNWFQPQDTMRDGGEAGSIAQMIRQAVRNHGVDPGRVFVTGLSAGGAMACAMLALYPEMFAGGAIVAGVPFGAARSMQEAFGAMFQGRARSASAWGALVRDAAPTPKRWPKISIWQGDADGTVKVTNAEEMAKQWTDVHGLDPHGGSVSLDGRRRRQAWARDGEVVVELNMIKGLAHGTPLDTLGVDGCGRAGPFLIEAGVSSSAEIVRFWGLAPMDRVVDGPSPSAAPAEPTGSPKPSVRPESVLSAARPAKPFKGVEQVIARALATAGLIKPGSMDKD